MCPECNGTKRQGCEQETIFVFRRLPESIPCVADEDPEEIGITDKNVGS